MDEITFKKQLKEIAQEYEEWFKPIMKFEKEYFRKTRFSFKIDPVLADSYVEDARDFEEKLRKENDVPQKVCDFMDQSYVVYLQATPTQTASFRSIVKKSHRYKDFLSTEYVRRSVEMFTQTKDIKWLERSLIGISIEDISADARDTLIRLAEIYVAGENAGVDIQSLFEKVAEISSKQEPKGGRTSLSEVLNNFINYAILKERREKKKTFWEEYNL